MPPLALAVMAPLLSCSLLVDDAVPTCTMQTQCEVLNVEQGIPASACARYVCVLATGRCTLTADQDGDGDPAVACGGSDCDDTPATGPGRRRDRAESPDGVDNNCNGVVDEGVWIEAARPLGPATAVPATLVGARSGAGSGGLAVMSSDGVGAASFGAVGEGAPALAAVTLQTVFTDNGAPVVMAGSPSGTPEAPTPPFSPGVLADLAAAPSSSGRWFAAAINVAGCGPGRLNLGTFAPMSPAITFDFRAPPQSASNLARGLPQACSGAARPAVAAIARMGQPDRALVAWQSREANNPAAGCGMPAQLRALGAWALPQNLTNVPPFDQVQGVGDGRPTDLDDTLGTDRPAVAALPDAAGFVVAYGLAAGGVGVRVVPVFEPSAMAGLDVSRPRLVIPATPGATVDQVVVAFGGVREGRPELGVAWREGCGPTGAIRFARVRLDVADPARSVVQVAALAGVRAEGRSPALAYVDGDFLQGGGAGAAPVVAPTDDGGWVLAWIDPAGPAARVRALRVSEASGDVLRVPAGGACACAGPEPIGEVLTAPSGALAFTLQPHDEGASSRLRVLAADAAQWRGVGLTPRRGPASPPPPRDRGACSCP